MIMPFLVIYFKNLDFSFLQIAIITSTFGISMFLFEVPTGVIADNYSRKYSIILGFFVSAAAVISIPLTTNFYIILSMWILAGLGLTFVSGAEESWVVDNLNYFKRKDLHNEFFIKSKSILAFGAIFSPFVGGVIVKNHSIEILWFIFGFSFILSAILLIIFGKEHYKPRRSKFTKSLNKIWKNSKKSLRFTLKHKVLLFIIIGGLFTHLMSVGENGWQPFLVNLGMAEHQLGYVYSLTAFVSMLMPFASKLFNSFKPKNAVSIIAFIRTIILFSIILIHPGLYILAAIIFIMDSGFFSMKEPIIQTYIHKFIPKKMRSTVVSTKNMFDKLIMGLSALVAGVFLDIVGPQKVLAFAGLFGIFAIISYQMISTYKGKTQS